MEFQIGYFHLEKKHTLAFAAFALLGFLYFIKPVVLLLMLIICLDFILSYLSFRKLDFGIDIMSLGIIYMTYFHGIAYSFFLIPFTIISRIFIGKIQLKHIIKFSIAFIVAFLALASRQIEFIPAAYIIIILRYTIDTAINGSIAGEYNILGKIHHLFSTLVFLSLVAAIF